MADATPKRDPAATDHAAPMTEFVPLEIDATRWEVLGPLYEALLERPVGSFEEFEGWLLDRSELDAAASEAQANLYITMSCHTDDDAANAAWTRYLEEVQPKRKSIASKLDRRHVELAERFGKGSERYFVLNRSVKNDVELFREENVALETEQAKLDQKYDQLCGDMLIEFQGEQRTVPQMARFLEESDRSVREAAWHAVSDRRLRDKDRIDEIFDRMIELRNQAARNAGYPNFRDYQHQRSNRFDYTPGDCLAFHEAIERHIVPFMRRLDERRKGNLGVDPLRPWDLVVDEKGRPALKPFEGGQDLIDRTRRVYERLDPELARIFGSLGNNMAQGGCFDLDSRKGKASGGYQYMRDRARRPFIFMNAAGVHRDVETMVHEAGHAFHSSLCAHDPLVWYRHSDIEFAEVASMTMELLTMPHWGEFYADESDANRARRQQMEGSLSLLTWIATIDAFQHWIYTHPKHTRAERRAFWLTLDDRFGHAVSWEGLDEARANQWQRQGHLFGNPFYYVEYGIAQLGALGIWLNSLEEGVGPALKKYKGALTLGGSRPLPELFEAAGVPFDFSADRVATLVEAVESELAKLPA